ncbi:MAG TPA: SPOR domain-containing protein [Steroidobacteraceae bacterium]|nr:SPOR domain-containing protein [Steroidobacteraceae bacterium]
MSAPRQRLSSRDYKHSGKNAAGLPLHYRTFAAGLVLGLAVALAVYVVDREKIPAVETKPLPKPKSTKPADDGDTGVDTSGSQYEFYNMLPKFEVIVPEKGSNARRDTTPAPVEQPGAYVLQVGSYRNRDDAERLRAKVAKLGIEARVQHVAIDADELHRVLIGPIRDLAKLNATRRELRAASIDAIMYQVAE